MKWNQELSKEKNVKNIGGHRPVEYSVDGCRFKFYSVESVAGFVESTKGVVQGKFYRSGKDEIEVNGCKIKRRFL